MLPHDIYEIVESSDRAYDYIPLVVFCLMVIALGIYMSIVRKKNKSRDTNNSKVTDYPSLNNELRTFLKRRFSISESLTLKEALESLPSNVKKREGWSRLTTNLEHHIYGEAKDLIYFEADRKFVKEFIRSYPDEIV